MSALSRRQFLGASAAASLVAVQDGWANAADAPANVHQQILELAGRQQEQRRQRFAAVASKADVEKLQQELRQKFLALLDGLPERSGVPAARVLGKIEGDDYIGEKLVFESFPAYYVSAVLYRPRKLDGKRPGIISPCGHSAVGKAAGPYQTLHINLAKRGYVVLTYDPVGQGERSQFWDVEKNRSRFNLSCGEHAILGNPLYLLGTSLARYRIHDGLCAIDYLAARPEVDAERIGCVGNSGGGTLTAYISALDPRVRVSVPSCYITTLPRRMGNRIERDPDSDPEQDIFGFVSAGIDHAGLLALMVPRPTLVNAAQLDFFPIEGTRESCAEVKKLYEAAGAGERFVLAEANQRHGMTLPLRQAAYAFFDRWLAARKDGASNEVPIQPREPKELLVTPEGQVNVALKSRHLLPLALEQFEQARKQGKPARVPLRDLLALDPADSDHRAFPVGTAEIKPETTLVLLINGNEGRTWQEEKTLLEALTAANHVVTIIEPRGVGTLRSKLEIKGRDYADPLNGVEENIAYNAFLAGKTLLGMRVTDVLAALKKLTDKSKPKRVVAVGRRDSALVACFAAAIEPAITQVAVEEMLTSYLPLFQPEGQAINAASILPRMLRDFGDIPDLLTALAPRPLLLAAPRGPVAKLPQSVKVIEKGFAAAPEALLGWLKG